MLDRLSREPQLLCSVSYLFVEFHNLPGRRSSARRPAPRAPRAAHRPAPRPLPAARASPAPLARTRQSLAHDRGTTTERSLVARRPPRQLEPVRPGRGHVRGPQATDPPVDGAALVPAARLLAELLERLRRRDAVPVARHGAGDGQAAKAQGRAWQGRGSAARSAAAHQLEAVYELCVSVSSFTALEDRAAQGIAHHVRATMHQREQVAVNFQRATNLRRRAPGRATASRSRRGART